MSTRIAIEFKKALANLLVELYEQFPGEVDIMAAQLYVSTVVDPDVLICHFIQYALPHKQDIHDRREDFILEKASNLLGANHQIRFDHFKRLWKSPQLDDDDRNAIWEWFDAFVQLAEKYGELKSSKK